MFGRQQNKDLLYLHKFWPQGERGTLWLRVLNLCKITSLQNVLYTYIQGLLRIKYSLFWALMLVNSDKFRVVIFVVMPFWPFLVWKMRGITILLDLFRFWGYSDWMLKLPDSCSRTEDTKTNLINKFWSQQFIQRTSKQISQQTWNFCQCFSKMPLLNLMKLSQVGCVTPFRKPESLMEIDFSMNQRCQIYPKWQCTYQAAI